MPSLKTAFRDHLVTDAGIQAYIGTDPGARVYPFAAPSDASLPYIIYQRISAIRDFAYSGGIGLTRQRLQVDSYAATALTTEAMAEAIRTRCHGFRGLMGTVDLDVRRLMLDDEDDRLTVPNKGSEQVTHRVRQDLFITFVESK